MAAHKSARIRCHLYGRQSGGHANFASISSMRSLSCRTDGRTDGRTEEGIGKILLRALHSKVLAAPQCGNRARELADLLLR